MTRESGARKSTSLATIILFSAAWLFAEPTGLAPRPQTASGQTSTGTVSPVPKPLPTTATQSTHLQIDHDPLACVTTERAPVVAAKVQPGPDVSKSYVFFRAPGDDYFYYAVMEGPVPDVKGVIPPPLPDVTSIEYFVQAMDLASEARQTPYYVPPVVKADVCREPGLAMAAGGGGLTIGLTDINQSPVPRGFNKNYIAKVILVTGVVVGIAAAAAGASGSAAAGGGAAAAGTGTGAAGAAGGTAGAAAATGGGLSTAAIIAGGAVAAAGIGYGINQAVSKNSPTPTPTFTPTPVTPPPITPVVNRFIEADATWSGLGKVTVQLLRGGTNVPGQTIPGPDCASTGSKTTRFIVQGQNVTNGEYVVILTGSASCPNAPTQIAAFVSVQTNTGPASSCGQVVNVPTSSTVPTTACRFTLPLQ